MNALTEENAVNYFSESIYVWIVEKLLKFTYAQIETSLFEGDMELSKRNEKIPLKGNSHLDKSSRTTTDNSYFLKWAITNGVITMRKKTRGITFSSSYEWFWADKTSERRTSGAS